MKILYVDMLYDYGIKNRGVNQIGQIGFLQVFKTLGHEVVEFYYDDYLKNTEPLQSLLLKTADDCKPDLIFFCLYTDQFKPETLLQLKARYKTMNWFGDDQWRFDKFTSKYAPCFTYSITTDPFAVPKYRMLGTKVILSQWAALNASQPTNNSPLQYTYDVSFVGGANGVRKWMVSEFRKAGIEVATFGNGWSKGPVTLTQMNEIFLKSKINLNLSNSVNLDLRYLTHHWKNIAYAIKNSKNASQMKARNFEIPYFGGFQLTEYLSSIEMYFDLGKELICFASIDEAVKLTKFYLENDDLRESIKSKAVVRARAQHTYLDRFKEIFNAISL